MHRSDRVSAILERLACGGTVNVVGVARELGVSVATIRRDLSLLDEQNLLIRTRGGAVGRAVAYELPVRYRDSKSRAAKQAIARMAMRCMTSGHQVVAINGGTTTGEVARLLATRTDLTVITNALNIAGALVNKPRVKLLVTGGVARPNSYELVGPVAEGTVGRVNIDTAFIGIDGINAKAGLSTYDKVEAQINALMISRARRVVVVADGSKIGRDLFAHVADLRVVTELVTDTSADVDELAAIAARGVVVRIAEVGGRRTRSG
ncbi:DeoR/GlpR transcriptional regulator [Streptomyces luteolifulvus]|jgi:DeoR family transcriptional regulator of aga operon|uniref:DeoR/GlpR transcriptional regulator n=1 Tax=Streptomyces luteolifulvus TaxID=2615112 RepID=A0A6H9US53_9ACTN|nr:DeoR/GlpR transcriptional regulator [Streptomyces luteolifulvus]